MTGQTDSSLPADGVQPPQPPPSVNAESASGVQFNPVGGNVQNNIYHYHGTPPIPFAPDSSGADMPDPGGASHISRQHPLTHVGADVRRDRDRRRRQSDRHRTVAADSIRRVGRWLRGRPSTTIGVGVVLALVTVGTAVVWWPQHVDAGCSASHATQLRVATYPAGRTWFAQVARQYTQATARDHCPQVRIDVYPASLPVMRAGLTRQWDYQLIVPEGEDGFKRLPRPDLWLTESPLDTAELSPAERALVNEKSVGWSPFVMVASKDLVSTPIGTSLADTVTASTSGTRFGILHAKPSASASNPTAATTPSAAPGDLATWALYSGQKVGQLIDSGRAKSLESAAGVAAITVGDLNDVAAQDYGDEVALVCRYRQLSAEQRAHVALYVTEQAYMLADGLSDSVCGSDSVGSPLTPTYSQLKRAEYDSGAPIVKRSVIQLNWPATPTGGSQPTPQQTWAKAFQQWLTGRDGACAVERAGLRGRLAAACGSWSPTGTLAPLEPPTSLEDLQPTLTLYSQSHRRRHVVVLLDTSGSMADADADATAKQTRFDIARSGIRNLANSLARNDLLALWTFPGASGPVTRHDFVAGQYSQAVEGVVGSVPVPNGTTTPLYQSIAAAAGTLGPSNPDEVTAVIAITDGADTSGILPTEVLGPGGTQKYVITVGGTTCAPELRAVVTDCVSATDRDIASVVGSVVARL
jgi:hypothetical protein